MASIEIIQFEDGEGGSISSWYAEGHVDEGEFAAALVELLLDAGDDIPSISLDRTHLYVSDSNAMVCERCLEKADLFEPKPDLERWTNHKMTDPSWAKWRELEDIAGRRGKG